MKTIGVIGLGLIGGSILKDLRSYLKDGEARFIGCDANKSHQDEALELGLIDEVLDQDLLVQNSDLIILAVPVDVARTLLSVILDEIDTQVVTDVGSTKSGICDAVSDHPNRGRFVAGHPIAGTENSGPSAAVSGLYKDKLCILCDTYDSEQDAIDAVTDMYLQLGMKIKQMKSDEHDKHMAYVSHLSHISSFALGLTVLNIEESEEQIFDLSGSGFESTVRLAKSSPEMWAPILEHNSSYLQKALDEYIDQLHDFKTFLKHGKGDDLLNMMRKANDIRRILDGEIEITT